MSKPQPIHMRLEMLYTKDGKPRAAWVAASPTDATAMRDKAYRPGDLVKAEIKKPRNLGFHRLAHAIGGLAAEHIERYEGMNNHQALKELQFDSGIECDVTRTEIPGVGTLESKQPRSMAFDAMEDGQFREFVSGVCSYIAKTYWPQCTAEQVEQMAELMVSEGQA